MDQGVDEGENNLLLPGEEGEGGALKMLRRIWEQVCLNLGEVGLIDRGCRLLPQTLLYLWLLSPGHCRAAHLWEWEAEGLRHAPEVQTSLQECCCLC